MFNPTLVIRVLFERPAEEIALVLARLFGAGIFSLGLVCVQSRNYVVSPAGFAVAYGMASYNVVAAVLIIWAAGSSLGGLVLWGAGIGHIVIGLLFARALMMLPNKIA